MVVTLTDKSGFACHGCYLSYRFFPKVIECYSITFASKTVIYAQKRYGNTAFAFVRVGSSLLELHLIIAHLRLQRMEVRFAFSDIFKKIYRIVFPKDFFPSLVLLGGSVRHT